MRVRLELEAGREFAILMEGRRSTLAKLEAGGAGADLWRDVLADFDRQILAVVVRAYWERTQADQRGQVVPIGRR